MSIINDALKKAHKEYKQGSAGSNTVNPAVTADKTGFNPKLILVIILSAAIAIAFLLGSRHIFKNIKRIAQHSDKKLSLKEKDISNELNIVKNKSINTLRTRDLVKLTGIVYYTDTRWAIINNKIFKEGDMINSDVISNISKDAVKIKKSNGEEIVLNLR